MILAKNLFNLYNTFSLILLGNRCSAITRIMVRMLIIIRHESSYRPLTFILAFDLGIEIHSAILLPNCEHGRIDSLQ